MKKIFVRSPYFINKSVSAINEEVTVKLFLWNKGTTEPLTPTYRITKSAPSLSMLDLSFNISNYALEYLKPIKTTNSLIFIEDTNTWCYMNVQIGNGAKETFVCLNGYTNYLDGVNKSSEQSILPLFNLNTKFNIKDAYLNVWVDAGTDIRWSTIYSSMSTGDVYRLRIQEEEPNTLFEVVGTDREVVFTIQNETNCDSVYEPINCNYVNNMGGWETITFYKARTESFRIESKTFETMQSNVNYNPLIGQKQVFNLQGQRGVRVNTGFVHESMSGSLQNLLSSRIKLLGGKPVTLLNKSIEFKTRVKDNNINYELDFEYNFGIINDQV